MSIDTVYLYTSVNDGWLFILHVVNMKLGLQSTHRRYESPTMI
jgi:hypothetical protein